MLDVWASPGEVGGRRTLCHAQEDGWDDKYLTIKYKVDFAGLPPCYDSLITHIERVNNRLANYKRAATPVFWHPKPHNPGQGWEKTADGILEPVWSCEPALPPCLIDLLENTAEEAENNEDDNEMLENDYDELFWWWWWCCLDHP